MTSDLNMAWIYKVIHVDIDFLKIEQKNESQKDTCKTECGFFECLSAVLMLFVLNVDRDGFCYVGQHETFDNQGQVCIVS